MQPHQGPLLPQQAAGRSNWVFGSSSPKRVREGGQTRNYEAKGGGRSAFVILGTWVPSYSNETRPSASTQGTWHPQQAACSVFSLADPVDHGWPEVTDLGWLSQETRQCSLIPSLGEPGTDRIPEGCCLKGLLSSKERREEPRENICAAHSLICIVWQRAPLGTVTSVLRRATRKLWRQMCPLLILSPFTRQGIRPLLP